MAYLTYASEGFVLSGRNVGEANRYLEIFTKELGLVRALARSARMEKSKLRFMLQDYAYGTFSLVKGKEVWRLTGAVETFGWWSGLHESKRTTTARICALLSRLLAGEERNEVLFEMVREGMLFLEREELTEEECACVEGVLVLRILSVLGYAPLERPLAAFGSSAVMDRKVLEEFMPLRRRAVGTINESLRESHL